MSRALRYTLIIGSAVAILLGLLHEMGWLTGLDRQLATIFGLGLATPVHHPIVQYLAIVTLAFGVAWATIDINRPDLKALIAGSALVQVFTGAALVSLFGWYFSPLLPGLAVVLSFAAAFFYARTEEGQRQRHVEALYGRRISDQTATSLVN